MSRSSYTASERRGVLLIAILALLLIGGGLGVSFCQRPSSKDAEYPIVVEHPEMVDSVAVKAEKETKKKNTRKGTKNKKASTTKKRPKTYPNRSPLDEPV